MISRAPGSIEGLRYPTKMIDFIIWEFKAHTPWIVDIRYVVTYNRNYRRTFWDYAGSWCHDKKYPSQSPKWSTFQFQTTCCRLCRSDTHRDTYRYLQYVKILCGILWTLCNPANDFRKLRRPSPNNSPTIHRIIILDDD